MPKSKTKAQRKIQIKKATQATNKELDSVFFLKLVFYLILGSLWLKVTRGADIQVPLPVGMLAGLVFAGHEHFQIDRKIEFAVLLIAMLVGFWMPFGIYINF
ncbi:hypothetical protein HY003_02450 [Candidatus Saccharibacteria bacterium]|nr:hypothetical protein [Candidatus Saccharibacteria bacterium]MBI3338137.1 hypothetical protein [Candidatus Saccharibacteria bacterium]